MFADLKNILLQDAEDIGANICPLVRRRGLKILSTISRFRPLLLISNSSMNTVIAYERAKIQNESSNLAVHWFHD